MKKVLIFHPTIAPYRIDFFNDLYKSFDTTISLFYENLKDQKFNYEEISSRFLFKPDYFTKKIKLFNREIPVGFMSRLKNENPDIVLVNEFGESCWLSIFYRFFSRKKFKIVSICDDSVDILNNGKGLHASARKLALKYLDGLILCNELVKNEYSAKYCYNNTFVMPIIQEENSFYKNEIMIKKESLKLACREELYNHRVFLYVGRISPEKNLHYLFKSFIKQHKDNPENVLIVIGDYIKENKEYNEFVDRIIKENDASYYIRKIGRKEGEILKSWLYLGQILVLPSTREPFGAVVNEALLTGNYVMVSSVAGSTCLVNDANGEIVDVKDEYICFERVNNRIPLLNRTYIMNKSNKMLFSYKDYFDKLVQWISEL